MAFERYSRLLLLAWRQDSSQQPEVLGNEKYPFLIKIKAVYYHIQI